MRALLMAALLAAITGQDAKTIAPEEAAKHVGETVIVQGTVSHVKIAQHDGAIYLDFGPTYPNQVFTAFIGEAPREDFIPYTADFFLQLEDVKWTIIAGVVGKTLIVSVRNLGYSRNAGEFVKRWFADIGSAGGHRAMAKAVVPFDRFREKFGDLDAAGLTARLADLAEQFLHEAAAEKKLSIAR